MSTQQKSRRALASNSSIEVVKWSRSAFSVTSSERPGSWKPTSPEASLAIFASSTSIAQTSLPWEAKHAAVTRPTHPTPTTPTGSLT